MAEGPDNSLMLEILKEIRKEQQEVRKEQQEQRMLLLLTSERVDRLDRHFDARLLGVEQKLVIQGERIRALKDDLETMLKAEMLGFQARIENYVDRRLAEKGE